jgi:alkylated DNA repair dioxygenase AlkB
VAGHNYYQSYCRPCQTKKRKEWADKNKERVKAYVHKPYKPKDPSRLQAQKNAYKRRVKQACPSWVDQQQILEIYLEAQKQGLHVDHIVPLKHELVCGLHVPHNLQLLTKEENSSKSNKFEVHH